MIKTLVKFISKKFKVDESIKETEEALKEADKIILLNGEYKWMLQKRKTNGVEKNFDCTCIESNHKEA